MDGHVGSEIQAASFLERANDTLIVTSNKDIGVGDTEGGRDEDSEFNCNCFQPTDVMSNGNVPTFLSGPHVPEIVPQDPDARASGSIDPDIIITGRRTENERARRLCLLKDLDPPFNISFDHRTHVVGSEFFGIPCDPAVDIGKVGASMGKYKGAMNESARDLFSITFEDHSFFICIKEGMDVEVIFTVFGFRETDQVIGKVEGIADIVTYIAELSTFRGVPRDVNGANIVFGRMEVVTIAVGDAIGDANEGTIRIRNTNDKGVIDPFPVGANMCMFPDVLSGVSNFTLKASCGGSTKRKVMIHIEMIMITYHKVAFVIRENGDGAIGPLNIERGCLGAQRSHGDLGEEGGHMSGWSQHPNSSASGGCKVIRALGQWRKDSVMRGKGRNCVKGDMGGEDLRSWRPIGLCPSEWEMTCKGEERKGPILASNSFCMNGPLKRPSSTDGTNVPKRKAVSDLVSAVVWGAAEGAGMDFTLPVSAFGADLLPIAVDVEIDAIFDGGGGTAVWCHTRWHRGRGAGGIGVTEVATAETDGGKTFVIGFGRVPKGLLIRRGLAHTRVAGRIWLKTVGFRSGFPGLFNFFETFLPVDASFNVFKLTIVLSGVEHLWVCNIGVCEKVEVVGPRLMPLCDGNGGFGGELRDIENVALSVELAEMRSLLTSKRRVLLLVVLEAVLGIEEDEAVLLIDVEAVLLLMDVPVLGMGFMMACMLANLVGDNLVKAVIMALILVPACGIGVVGGPVDWDDEDANLEVGVGMRDRLVILALTLGNNTGVLGGRGSKGSDGRILSDDLVMCKNGSASRGTRGGHI
ncbi:hypothetical protein BDR04DRAFT_1119687 [Suillus decipiens]|nr:hypothetical protein BDR04DRAFT_1119687 [Suillus decipiens]